MLADQCTFSCQDSFDDFEISEEEEEVEVVEKEVLVAELEI